MERNSSERFVYCGKYKTKTCIEQKQVFEFSWYFYNLHSFSDLGRTLQMLYPFEDEFCAFSVEYNQKALHVVVYSSFPTRCLLQLRDKSGAVWFRNEECSELRHDLLVKGIYPSAYKCQLMTKIMYEKLVDQMQNIYEKEITFYFRITNLGRTLSPESNAAEVKFSTSHLRYTAKLAAEFNVKNISLDEMITLWADNEVETIHKAVLCARSPFFETMLSNPMPEQPIRMDDMPMPAVKLMTSYLYVGMLLSSDWQILCHLYKAAIRYEISGLSAVCVRQLQGNVHEDNVCQILMLAQEYGDAELERCVTEYVKSTSTTGLSPKVWETLMRTDLRLALETVKSN